MCRSINQSIYQSIYLSFYLSIYLPTHNIHMYILYKYIHTYIHMLYTFPEIRPILVIFGSPTGLSNWRHGWSFGKKKWCCENKHVACAASAPAQHPPVHVVHHVVHHLPPAHHGPRPVHVVQEVQQPIMYPTYHSALTESPKA